MAQAKLALQYKGRPNYSLDLSFGDRQIIRHSFTAQNELLDVTDVVSLGELNRNPIFRSLLAAKTFSVIETPGDIAGQPMTQTVRITQQSASPYDVLFSDLGLPDMADDTYTAELNGEGAGKILESSRATTGFTIVGGTAFDVYDLILIGHTAG